MNYFILMPDGGLCEAPQKMSEKTDLTETGLETEWMCRGRLLHAKRDTVRLPNGHTSTREYIVHPGIFWRFSGRDAETLARKQAH